MMKPPTTRATPYVGPVPIRTGELLFGRDREVETLVDLVIAKRIVLLHSPSGAGKTSVVQAGLIPALRDEGFVDLPIIRVNKETPGDIARVADREKLNRYTLSTLLSLQSEQEELKRLTPSKLASLSLSAYLDRRASEIGEEATVLIFDQFEEILTLDPIDLDAKHDFFRQLGEALRNRRRWALFAIREDYIGSLDPYLQPIPTQLSVRMHFDLLTKEAARQAIQRPRPVGTDEEMHLLTENFTREAAAELAKDLAKIRVQQRGAPALLETGPYVEPVQLQVVCERLWREAQERGESQVGIGALKEVGTVDEALAGYFVEKVGPIADQRGVPEWRIRRWFDQQLITAQGIRGQVMRGVAQSEGLENEVIEELIDAYLVRQEQRRGVTWYELAHDRLIEPVRQSNAKWEQKYLEALTDRYAERVPVIASELGVHEGRIRDWLDHKLITEQGTRTLVRETEIEREGLKDAVDRLADLGLVRKERRRGDTWYELAHDRLIEPVRADNAAWRWARLSFLPRQARLWEEEGRAGFLLLDGQALKEAETWAQSHPDELTPVDRKFLAACRKAQNDAKEKQRMARWIRRLAIGATISTVIAILLCIVAGYLALALDRQSRNLSVFQEQQDQTRVAQSDNATATWAAGATEMATVALPEQATQAAQAAATLTAQVLAAPPTPTPTFTPIETPTATNSPTRPGGTPIPTEPVLPTLTATPDETQAAAQATVHVIQTVEMQLTGEPPTATAQAGDCAYEPQGDFRELWKTAEVQMELGCPGSVYPVGGTFAEQAFEGGRMIWSQIGDQFFVIVYGKQGAGEGTWLLYQATEIPVINPDGVSCKADTQPPPGLMQPVRGFGGVWCHLDPQTREAIGFATEVERSVTGNLLQQFEAGWVLRDSKNSVYVLFEYQGSYVRRDIVFVPGGELSMGSADDLGQPNEHPRARVGIWGFWLDRFEVTNAEYRRCVEAGLCKPPHRENNGSLEVRSFTRSDYYTNPKFDQFPVLFVSWHDASTYCTWSGKRLPTEAEWEWAAKGRVNYLYPWGNEPEPSASLANYDGNVGDTQAVGQYAASPLGLYDMAGNVWEWTSSLYWDYPYNPKDGREDSTAAGDRVLRGGSWRDGPDNLRTANRNSSGPDWPLDNIGIRCAMSTP